MWTGVMIVLVLYLVATVTISASPLAYDQVDDPDTQSDCENADPFVLYINGVAFDGTNDDIVHLEAEDNTNHITLNALLMGMHDQVVHYETTNATNANGTPSNEYYLPVSTFKTITMTKNRLTPINIQLHQIQFHHNTTIYFSMTFYFECKIITIKISTQFLKPTVIHGDPHFTVPLLNGENLCYSVQGIPGLPFNLLSNRHLIINAFFINDDPTQFTRIGKLAVIPQSASTPQAIIFDCVSQSVWIKEQGTFKPQLLQYIIIDKTGSITVKTTLVQQMEHPVVEVHLTNPTAVFYVTFHEHHIDIDWKMQSDEINNSHGLLGQFIAKDIKIDATKQILIRPGFEPVPVRPSKSWNSPDKCWVTKTEENQGEGLIKGSIYDYIVDTIESTNVPTDS